ncbi:MAG: glycosyltransferase [Nitrospinaceae bacterium]|nr:glycosyltransferase [Nitrospinaceae bacterium]
MSTNDPDISASSSRPDITILTTSFPRFAGDNAGRFVYNFSYALSQSGCTVQVIAPDDSEVIPQSFPFTVKNFPYFFPRSLQSLAYGAGMASRIKRNGWRLLQLPFFVMAFFFAALKSEGKILHAYWTLAGLVALAVKFFTGKYVVINLWGSDILFTKIPILWYCLSKAFNRADAIICESQDFADQLIAKGLTRQRITVLPNGLDLQQFKPMDQISQRKQLGLPTDRPLLLSVGNLSERKGHKYLLQALSKILQSYGPVLVVIVGEGEFRSSIEATIADLKLENSVHLAGFQKGETIANWLNAADIFILPSLLEGTPNILLEAMACQLAVVSTRVGGVGHVIEDGTNGCLVQPKSEIEIADTVVSLLQDPDLCQQLGKNARETIYSKYGSWKEQSLKLKNLYAKILVNTIRSIF